MPQFCPNFDVVSKKKKVFKEKRLCFLRILMWPPKKRSSFFHTLISQCHFDEPSEANGPHDGTPWSPSAPSRAPQSLWAPGSLSPLPSLSWPCSAFSALEVEKRFLTIKLQDFIKRAPCRGIAVYIPLEENCKRKLGCYGYNIFSTILSRPLSSLHHKVYTAPATTSHLQGGLWIKIQKTLLSIKK